MDNSNNSNKRPIGTVVSVRGSVILVRFSEELPALHHELRTGADENIIVEVVEYVDERTARGIALTKTQGLQRGARVIDTGRLLQVPVGERVLARVFNVLGETIDRGEPLSEGKMRSIRRGSAYAPVMHMLLPLDLNWLQGLQGRPWHSRSLPMFRMGWEDIFAALIREHFFVSIFCALADSLASENASRLSSMQAAENNIDEELTELEREFLHLRQSSITEDLLDIVAGYEALTEG